jgi:hypothetical protein
MLKVSREVIRTLMQWFIMLSALPPPTFITALLLSMPDLSLTNFVLEVRTKIWAILYFHTSYFGEKVNM